MKKKINIGLFGFGVVGQGLVDVIKQSPSIDISIQKICVADLSKQRTLPVSQFTVDEDELINDPEINLIVELIDDAESAYRIVKKAIIKGKNVVTANKKMLAFHLKELIELQHTYNVSLLYEPSSCGSIPIIRNLEEYYDNDLLISVSGILNGSSNYILSRIFNEKQDYLSSLKQAQELGYAESNPILDVGGFDSLYKLIIITAHAFGVVVDPAEVFNYGITGISENDILYAREKGSKIKLVACVKKVSDENIALFVMPQFVKPEEYIYNVENQFNGVVIEGLSYDKQFMFGKGAGGKPTASAVLSDITALLHNYRYEYKKINHYSNLGFTNDLDIEVYLSYRDEKTVELLQFTEFSERYTSENFSYIIGKVRLDKLVQIQAKLPELDAFLAFTGGIG